MPELAADEQALVRWAGGESFWSVPSGEDDEAEVALTREEAEEILADPERWSWRVLARASDVCGRNVRSCVPAEWMEPFEPREVSVEVAAGDAPEPSFGGSEGVWWEPRRLGQGENTGSSAPCKSFASAVVRSIGCLILAA